MKIKADNIKEQERKLLMNKHDFKMQSKDVESILKDIVVEE
jgi:hypothetical protein